MNDGNEGNGTANVHVTVLYYPTAIDDNATTFIDLPVTINILDNGIILHLFYFFSFIFHLRYFTLMYLRSWNTLVHCVH